MAQKIPITLIPIPAPVGIKNANFNQLQTAIAQYMEASISESVDFFKKGPTDPNSDVGIFFNTLEDRFKTFNTGLGKYIPISELQVGDLKSTFVKGDDPALGWIQVDGRNVNAVNGITQEQKNVLNTLFGVNAVMPNYQFTQGISGLPQNTSFTNIPNPTVAPANNVIGSLPFSPAFDHLEAEALRDDTETLRDSADSTQQALASAISLNEKILNVLNGVQNGTGPVIKVFVGYP